MCGAGTDAYINAPLPHPNPRPPLSGYRLINGEGDGLPGLVRARRLVTLWHGIMTTMVVTRVCIRVFYDAASGTRSAGFLCCMSPRTPGPQSQSQTLPPYAPTPAGGIIQNQNLTTLIPLSRPTHIAFQRHLHTSRGSHACNLNAQCSPPQHPSRNHHVHIPPPGVWPVPTRNPQPESHLATQHTISSVNLAGVWPVPAPPSNVQPTLTQHTTQQNHPPGV